MKTNKKLIAVALASIVMSTTASAAKSPDFLSDTVQDSSNDQVVKSLEIGNKKANKAVEPKVSVAATSYADAEAFVNPDISAERSAEISEKQHKLEMLKLDMQAAEIQNTLSQMKAEENKAKLDEMMKAKEAEWSKEKAELISDYEAQISSLQKEIKSTKQKMKEDNEIRDFLKEKLFVTKIYGIGNNKRAQFYFENNVSTLTVGQEIVPGAKVVRIENNGAEVSYKGKKAFLNITTAEIAHSKTLAKEELEFERTLEQAKYGVVSVPSDIGGVPPMPGH